MTLARLPMRGLAALLAAALILPNPVYALRIEGPASQKIETGLGESLQKSQQPLALEDVRILIAEDNKFTQRVCVRIVTETMRNAGKPLKRTQIGAFAKVSDALRWLRTNTPQVVVLDFHLLGGNGLTIADRVQKKDPSSVIVYRGNAVAPRDVSRVKDYVERKILIEDHNYGAIARAIQRRILKRLQKQPSAKPNPSRENPSAAGLEEGSSTSPIPIEGQRVLLCVLLGDFGLAVRDALQGSPHHIVGVVAGPRATELIQWAHSQRIPVWDTRDYFDSLFVKEKMRTDLSFRGRIEKLAEELRALKPDVGIAATFYVLPEPILNVVGKKFFNIHPSDLPRYRGGFAIPAQILNQETEMSVTLHEAVPETDAGAIVKQAGGVSITESDDAETLQAKVVPIAARLVREALDDLGKGTYAAAPQGPPPISFSGWGVRTKRAQDSEGQVTRVINEGLLPKLAIDWPNVTSEELRRRVRAFRPHQMGLAPYTNYQGNRLFLIRADPLSESFVGQSGQILRVDPDGSTVIKTVDGAVKVWFGRMESDDHPLSQMPRFQLKVGDFLYTTEPVSQVTGIPHSDAETIELIYKGWKTGDQFLDVKTQKPKLLEVSEDGKKVRFQGDSGWMDAAWFGRQISSGRYQSLSSAPVSRETVSPSGLPAEKTQGQTGLEEDRVGASEIERIGKRLTEMRSLLKERKGILQAYSLFVDRVLPEIAYSKEVLPEALLADLIETSQIFRGFFEGVEAETSFAALPRHAFEILGDENEKQVQMKKSLADLLEAPSYIPKEKGHDPQDPLGFDYFQNVLDVFLSNPQNLQPIVQKLYPELFEGRREGETVSVQGRKKRVFGFKAGLYSLVSRVTLEVDGVERSCVVNIPVEMSYANEVVRKDNRNLNYYWDEGFRKYIPQPYVLDQVSFRKDKKEVRLHVSAGQWLPDYHEINILSEDQKRVAIRYIPSDGTEFYIPLDKPNSNLVLEEIVKAITYHYQPEFTIAPARIHINAGDFGLRTLEDGSFDVKLFTVREILLGVTPSLFIFRLLHMDVEDDISERDRGNRLRFQVMEPQVVFRGLRKGLRQKYGAAEGDQKTKEWLEAFQGTRLGDPFEEEVNHFLKDFDRTEPVDKERLNVKVHPIKGLGGVISFDFDPTGGLPAAGARVNPSVPGTGGISPKGSGPASGLEERWSTLRSYGVWVEQEVRSRVEELLKETPSLIPYFEGAKFLWDEKRGFIDDDRKGFRFRGFVFPALHDPSIRELHFHWNKQEQRALSLSNRLGVFLQLDKDQNIRQPLWLEPITPFVNMGRDVQIRFTQIPVKMEEQTLRQLDQGLQTLLGPMWRNLVLQAEPLKSFQFFAAEPILENPENVAVFLERLNKSEPLQQLIRQQDWATKGGWLEGPEDSYVFPFVVTGGLRRTLRTDRLFDAQEYFRQLRIMNMRDFHDAGVLLMRDDQERPLGVFSHGMLLVPQGASFKGREDLLEQLVLTGAKLSLALQSQLNPNAEEMWPPKAALPGSAAGLEEDEARKVRAEVVRLTSDLQKILPHQAEPDTAIPTGELLDRITILAQNHPAVFGDSEVALPVLDVLVETWLFNIGRQGDMEELRRIYGRDTLFLTPTNPLRARIIRQLIGAMSEIRKDRPRGQDQLNKIFLNKLSKLADRQTKERKREGISLKEQLRSERRIVSPAPIPYPFLKARIIDDKELEKSVELFSSEGILYVILTLQAGHYSIPVLQWISKKDGLRASGHSHPWSKRRGRRIVPSREDKGAAKKFVGKGIPLFILQEAPPQGELAIGFYDEGGRWIQMHGDAAVSHKLAQFGIVTPRSAQGGLEEERSAAVAAWGAARDVLPGRPATAAGQVLVVGEPALLDLVPAAVLGGLAVAVTVDGPAAVGLEALLQRLPEPKGPYAIGPAAAARFLQEYPPAQQVTITNRAQLLALVGLESSAPPAVVDALDATRTFLDLAV